MFGMRTLVRRPVGLALAMLLMLAATALANTPNIFPNTETPTAGSGSPPGDRVDYWINTGGGWDEPPGWFCYPDFIANSVTFCNSTGNTIRLLEMGFSAMGNPSDSFTWGIYTNVGSMSPPPQYEPEFWGMYHPNETLTPYVDIDLEGEDVYIASGTYFSFYYVIPEEIKGDRYDYGGGLFDLTAYQGWYWEDDARGWLPWADYGDGYTPAFQFYAKNISSEITVCPSGGADFTDIQSAIKMASDGATIWLCDGLYYGEGNYNIDFMGKDLTVRSESDNPEDCVIYLGPLRDRGSKEGRRDPSAPDRRDQGFKPLELGRGGIPGGIHGFLIHNSEGPGAVLRGVTVEGGYSEAGTGVFIDHASPTIENCRFLNNWAECSGGGIYCAYSNPHIVDCYFEGNLAKMFDGGGILAGACDLDIENCVFYNNWADTGGGVACLDCPSVDFAECTFEENAGWSFGGAIYANNSQGSLFDCNFEGNGSEHMGGAFGCYEAYFSAELCEARGNSAQYGGAFGFSASVNTVEDCFFWENEAKFGGALLSDSGGRGGGYSLTVESCTIVENEAKFGSGVFFDQIDLTLVKSIVAENLVGPGVLCFNSCAPTIICTDIVGNEGGDWDEPWLAKLLPLNDNFMEDPQFCGDPGTGNCELQSDSPCMPDGNECNVLIGAFDQGCGTQAAQPMSWGDVKSLY